MRRDASENPFADRYESLRRRLARRRISAALVSGEMNILSLTGVECDNACLVCLSEGMPVIFTDFRYVPAVRRVAPWLRCVEVKRSTSFPKAARRFLESRGIKRPERVGYEGSISASCYLSLAKSFPKAALVDVEGDILDLRAVKTPDEIARIAAAESLNDEIWSFARREFRRGMTEKEMQRVIRGYMNALGDGEAFETIVCAGANAAECHHVPDDTVWRSGEPLLVDMGVKLDGVCADMTRNIVPRRPTPEYARVYASVLEANKAAIAAVRPGVTAGSLDKAARTVLRKAGYGRAFGHALGHGVGYEVHERPTARAGDKTILRPGMLVTIEPGVYLPGRLGVRIEDLVLVTADGCEVLSHSLK